MSAGWPSCTIPPLPPPRGFESSAKAELRPRYEDVTQDGRVILATLMPGLGAVWRSLGESKRVESFREQGVLPILRRIVIEGAEGPFSPHVPIEYEGTWRLAREANGDRILLNMWLEAMAPHAAAFGPAPASDAERVLVGRVFAEHVVTRPFAPPTERKVTRLDVPGLPPVPEDEHEAPPAEALLVGRSLAVVAEHRFGRMHTDSNQHVNSLVYPRMFEEAVVRAGVDSLLARALELRYRKPFFGGERASLAIEVGSGAAVGAFAPIDAAAAPENGAKPSCTAAMRLG